MTSLRSSINKLLSASFFICSKKDTVDVKPPNGTGSDLNCVQLTAIVLNIFLFVKKRT